MRDMPQRPTTTYCRQNQTLATVARMPDHISLSRQLTPQRPAPLFFKSFSELAFAIISAEGWRVVIDDFSVFSWVCSVDSFAVAVARMSTMLAPNYSASVKRFTLFHLG